MKNFSIHSCLFIVIFVVFLSSCQSEKASDFATKVEILQTVRPYLQESTEEILFGSDANPQQYFLQGWNGPEQKHTWATGPKSSLAFYRYNTQQDGEIAILCQSIGAPKGQENLSQTTRVFLNGSEIGSFVVRPFQLEEFTLSLPKNLVKEGHNVLEFEFSYSHQGKKDKRRKSVAFQRIRFSNNDTVKYINEREILQQNGSDLTFFQQLPQKFWLNISYQSLKGAKASLEFVSESQKTKHIKLSSRKQQYGKVVQLPEPGIYKIRLVTDGTAESHTVWQELSIQLQQAPAEENMAEAAEGFTRQSKPDMVLYVVDALRADHLHCYGYERETSPNVDKFAEEQAFFQEAYAADSWTRASGATILTGLLPKNHKTMSRVDVLPEDLVTLAEILQENGYYTAGFISNWNLSHTFGFKQGFDLYKEYLKDPATDFPVHSGVINEGVFEFLNTFTESKERQPLFLLVWTVDPHDPYSPEPEVKDLFDIDRFESIDTYDRKFLSKLHSGKIQPTPSQLEYIKTRYDQEIYFNDQSFGELLEELKRVNIYDDAVVIFTSDHGEEFLEHGGYGHARTLYNEQIQVPFIIKASQLPPGKYDARMQHTDIYPTLLDIVGVKPPYQIDGISLLGHSDSQRPLYFEEELNENTLTAFLDGQKKIIYNKASKRPPSKEEVPRIEIFENSDRQEKRPLDIQDYADQLRWQNLMIYTNSESSLEAQQTQIELSPELDEKLKDLGYVK